MSTTYEHAHSPVMGYHVRREIQRRLQHHVVSSTEEVLLWTHRLDPRNHKSWYSTAFQGWLQDHRLRSECDIHESQLAPLALRGAASAEGACSVSWHFAWTRAFRAATQVSERVALETAIHEIVTAEEDWAQRMALPLLGLAWACVETAVKGGDDMQLHVAQLAVRLYGAFAKENPVHALVFGELLKRCAWEEFEAWWATGGQWSLSSSTYARNREALNLANSSVKFIGELYRVAMCPPSFPRYALRLLCPSRSLSVAIEQLRAVGSLCSYMDVGLRTAEPTKLLNLKSAFEASCRRPIRSWTGQAYDKIEAVILSNYVDRLICSWEHPSLPLSQRPCLGQPVFDLNEHSMPSSSSYHSGWSSPSMLACHPPPPQCSSSPVVLYSSSRGSSYAVPAYPKRR